MIQSAQRPAAYNVPDHEGRVDASLSRGALNDIPMESKRLVTGTLVAAVGVAIAIWMALGAPPPHNKVHFAKPESAIQSRVRQ